LKKNRSQFIMLGMLMVPTGICYFILLPYVLPVSQTVDMQPWVNLIGHLIWAMSPVLVFLGMRLKVPEEEKTRILSAQTNQM
jgi:hypothetical protein